MHPTPRWIVAAACMGLALDASAMGLRSFVALPLEQGGTVTRFLAERNDDTKVDTLTTELAHGLSATQTLIFAWPYRLSPAGSNRSGDVTAMYRHTAWRVDEMLGTQRLALLGGAVLPTDASRDTRALAGVVGTVYRGRLEWDADALWIEGLGKMPDEARYDLSWQYRLAPAAYPEWGAVSEWDAVLELNGRWQRGAETIHQLTLGLQHIRKTWLLEGGMFRDLNGPKDTHWLLSVRLHF